MSKIFTFLQEMETKLSEIRDVKTVKIGMEKGIGAKDCPFIRIVPVANTKGKIGGGAQCRETGFDDLTVQIIFGFDLKSNNLPKLYDAFYELEEEIRSAVVSKYTSRGVAKFVETLTDQDELVSIKSAISRFEISGIR